MIRAFGVELLPIDASEPYFLYLIDDAFVVLICNLATTANTRDTY